MLEGLRRTYDLTSPYASEATSNENRSIMMLGHMGLCSEPADPLWDPLSMTKACKNVSTYVCRIIVVSKRLKAYKRAIMFPYVGKHVRYLY